MFPGPRFPGPAVELLRDWIHTDELTCHQAGDLAAALEAVVEAEEKGSIADRQHDGVGDGALADQLIGKTCGARVEERIVDVGGVVELARHLLGEFGCAVARSCGLEGRSVCGRQ